MDLEKLQTEMWCSRRADFADRQRQIPPLPSPLGWQSPVLTKIQTVWEWPLGRSLNRNHIIINHCLAQSTAKCLSYHISTAHSEVFLVLVEKVADSRSSNLSQGLWSRFRED